MRATQVVELQEPDMPKPVRMTDEILQFLRDEVANVPEEQRLIWGKKMGIGLIDPYPMFGDVAWYGISLCGLHYKTTKVLDLLNACTKCLAMWDEAHGFSISQELKVGKCLEYFLHQLDTKKCFSKKLKYYVETTRTMFVKTAGRANLAMFSSCTKNLEAYLNNEDKVSRRLIGEQANVVLVQIEEILDALKAARDQEARTLERTKEDGMDTIFSIIYTMGNYLRDIVYYMSLTTHPDGETPEAKKKRLEEVANGYRLVCKKLEFLQSMAFPDMFRPYDLIATSVGPDIMDRLTEMGFLMGEVGLLEVMEAYHQYVKKLPVFRINNAFNGNMSGCMAKLLKILLINIYGEVIDPLPLKERRQSYRHHNSKCLTRTTKASHIKVVYPFDGVGCLCGRQELFSQCSYCSYSKVEKIDVLCKKAVQLLSEPNVTAANINQLHREKDKIFKNCWMKNNKF